MAERPVVARTTLEGPPTPDPPLHPFAALMRRYSFAYTATHDFAVCDQVMVDDYVLRMGEHVIRGRDSAYKPATARQYRQFPGLGFSVHELICNGERAALHFSEYGWSVLARAHCSWSGVSLYRWDGHRLLECRLEQDYYARRRQLETKVPDEVGCPGWDPWMTPIERPVQENETLVREWLHADGLSKSPDGALDDERWVGSCRARLALDHVDVPDLFSAGEKVVFQAVMRGRYAGGLTNLDAHIGTPAEIYATGIVTVRDGTVGDVRAITDRLGLEKRLTG
jgi:predicted ester cyclase